MILIDLQKDFDTINHEILDKLHAVGFSAKLVAWFNHFSDLSKISCGFPQESI